MSGTNLLQLLRV